MKNLNETAVVITWTRGDFAVALAMSKSEDIDALNINYGEVPTEEQITSLGITDEDIDELIAESSDAIEDCSNGWEAIEDAINRLNGEDDEDDEDEDDEED